MSAVGTTLFHSPGCNEGKARNGTLGTRRQTRIELRRSGTNRASICLGQNSVALAGLIYVISTNQLLGYFHGLALVCPQAGAYRVSDYSYLCKDLILGML